MSHCQFVIQTECNTVSFIYMDVLQHAFFAVAQ